MIYLIDDNQKDQRRINYNISFIEEGHFSDILVTLDKLPKSTNLDKLKIAKCVLLHSTTEDVDDSGNFIQGSRSNAIKIKEQICNEGDKIPLVLFSNGMDEKAFFDFEKNPNYISAIKKNKFYDNLYDFLDNYRRTGLVDLRIIAFGKMFKSIEIARSGNTLLTNLSYFTDDDTFSISKIISIEEFRTFCSLSQNNTSFTDFIDTLTANQTTIGQIKKNIRLIIESYAQYNENLHTWQY